LLGRSDGGAVELREGGIAVGIYGGFGGRRREEFGLFWDDGSGEA